MSYSRDEYFTTIVCAECGHSCKFACLDAHKSSFACHNPDCINHLGKVEVGIPGGVLFSRKSSRNDRSSRRESSSHHRSRSTARHPEEPSSHHRSRSSARRQEPPSHHRSRSSARHPEEPSSHHGSRFSARYPEDPRLSSGYAPQEHPSSYHRRYDGNADYVTVEPDVTEHLRQHFERMGRDERPRYPPSSSHYQYPPSSSHRQYPPSSSHPRSRFSTKHHEELGRHGSRSHRRPVHEEIEIVDAGSSPFVPPSSKRGRQNPPRSSRRYAYGPYDEPPRTPDLPPAPYIYVGTWDAENNQID